MDFCLPKVYPFPPKSLYIEHEKDGQFLREMLMRLLSSAPLVQLEVILVDALSLGGIKKNWPVLEILCIIMKKKKTACL